MGVCRLLLEPEWTSVYVLYSEWGVGVVCMYGRR